MLAMQDESSFLHHGLVNVTWYRVLQRMVLTVMTVMVVKDVMDLLMVIMVIVAFLQMIHYDVTGSGSSTAFAKQRG